MLRTSGYAVRTYESGDAFLKAVPSLDPGCVLLDVRMPGIDGLEVQTRLRERGIIMPVVVMTGHGDVSLAVQAMKAGAIDFLEKPVEKGAMLRAVAAAIGRLVDVDRHLKDRTEAETRIAALTAREREVLEGLAKGHPNKTIAYDLAISPRTVEVHRANLMNKLRVTSLSDALRIAFAAGLPPEERSSST
ncbi:response regulator [Sphingomonas sp. TDK1]|uniref:response regulator transcription factor n=1 Tax=Sphingomonas sp. TDK1 TaxID=453247 RepID=UPI000AA8AD24